MVPVFWHGVGDSEPKRAQFSDILLYGLSARYRKCKHLQGISYADTETKK